YETEPGAARLAGRGRVDLGELPEQLGEILGRDPFAAVAHRHLNLTVDRLDDHVDAASRGRELDRVREEVGEHLGDAAGVDRDVRQARSQVELNVDVALVDQRLQVVQGLLDHRLDRLALEVHAQRGG